MLLIQVDLPHLCAGVISDNGEIVEVAPILTWALGKSPQQLAKWVLKKGGQITVVRRWRK